MDPNLHTHRPSIDLELKIGMGVSKNPGIQIVEYTRFSVTWGPIWPELGSIWNSKFEWAYLEIVEYMYGMILLSETHVALSGPERSPMSPYARTSDRFELRIGMGVFENKSNIYSV